MTTKYSENLFDRYFDCQYERINETNLKVTLPIQPLFLNRLGIVHGGIICSLADIAMGNTIIRNADNNQKIVTVDLKTTFVKAAKGNLLIADTHLIKKGKTLIHVDCFIYDEHKELVTKANGIFANI
jgi:uncharacterized protein (TIGR00369 family)